jgi:hypothetical protein
VQVYGGGNSPISSALHILRIPVQQRLEVGMGAVGVGAHSKARAGTRPYKERPIRTIASSYRVVGDGRLQGTGWVPGQIRPDEV